jgi:MFS transporter, DHA2 family, multidrug resistance protein
MTTPTATESLRAGRREWIGLAVLALPTLLTALDFSVVFLALPFLGNDLQASNSQLLWITDIYGFMVAGFLVTMGTLGDRIGRRKLLMIGGTIFAIVSIIAAYSTSAEMLIVARALLGIAGATLAPSILALITNMFRDPRQRATAISLWATSLLVGIAIGPVIGGVLLQYFWWGSVFLMGVPVMAVVLVTAPFLLPEYRDDESGRLDLVSVVLSLAAILPVIYGFKKIAEDGFGSQAVLAMAIGVGFGAAFVSRQRRLADPLLDVGLFGNRSLSAALGIHMLGALLVGGVGFFYAQYLQLVHGLSPFQAGLWLIPDALGLIVGSLLSPIIVRWMRPGTAIALGMAAMAVGFLMLTQVQTGSGLAFVATGVAVVSLGIAPAFVLSTDLVVGSVPPTKAGSASSLSETGGELGVALSVALLGSVGVAVYRTQLADSVPDGIPPDAAHAANESLAMAAGAAAQLPGPLGTALFDAGREAFTAGFNAAAAVSVPVGLVLAALALVLLRHLRSPGEEETTADDNPQAPDQTEATTSEVEMNGRLRPGLHQLPGDGVLARYGDLVLVCEARPEQDSRVGVLLGTLAAAAAERSSGRELSRRLAGLLGTAEMDDFPALCAFGPAGDGPGSGIAAVVHGNARLSLTCDGEELRLDGREAVILVDRVVPRPVDSIQAVVGEGPDALVYGPTGMGNGRPEPAASDAASDAAPEAAPEAPAESAEAAEGSSDAAAEAATEAKAEAEAEATEAAEAAEETDTADAAAVVATNGHAGNGNGHNGQVIGIHCARSHFNDPNVTYCAVCGISMTQAVRKPVLGNRPPLGVLVLDDGTMFPLERDHVFGREPESDTAVAAGEANAVPLADPLVSRVHAKVLLEGWEVSVVDAQSTNGTFVWGPDSTSWTKLPPGEKTRLLPGVIAAIGSRQLRYHSYRSR